MREGLRSLLEKTGEFECIAEADDGYQAVMLATELRPDVVIMDIAMPNLNGIEATRQIKTELPEVEVVVLSMHATRKLRVLQVFQAGASAYSLKDSAFEELSTALLAISRGGMYLSPAITKTAALANLKGGSGGLCWTGRTPNKKRTASAAVDCRGKIDKRYRGTTSN
jgi:DNA-binding NarL/FixJ family response regulator